MPTSRVARAVAAALLTATTVGGFTLARTMPAAAATIDWNCVLQADSETKVAVDSMLTGVFGSSLPPYVIGLGCQAELGAVEEQVKFTFPDGVFTCLYSIPLPQIGRSVVVGFDC